MIKSLLKRGLRVQLMEAFKELAYREILRDQSLKFQGGYLKTDYAKFKGMTSFLNQLNRTQFNVGFLSEAKHVKKAKHVKTAKHFAVTSGQRP